MKRDDSLKKQGSYHSHRGDARRYSVLSTAGSSAWRQNSLTINVLAQHSAYLAQIALSQKKGDEDLSNLQPVSWYDLFRFATPCEIFCLLLGVFFGTLNGLFVPLGMVLYGEFTSLLIDRTVMTGTSTKCLTVNLFGGCQLLSNATAEENRLALIKDSEAFGIGCFAFSVLQWIVAAISLDLFNYTALRQINRVKEKFLRAVLRQDISWYDMNTSMNFATKVSDDIEKYREGFAEKIPILVYLVTSFLSAVVISFFYGWLLTLVLLSCTPVIIITTAIVAKIQASLTTKELEAYSVAGVVAEEVLSSVRTVVAFGGEEKEIARYSERLKPANKTGVNKGLYSGIGSGIMWFIIYATYALAFWFGVGLILEDRALEEPVYTPAVLMIVFFSILQGAQNVGLTSPHLEAIGTAQASAAAIFSVLDRKPAIDSMSTEGARPHIDGDIELKDVYFQYPARRDVQVLNGLNLTIPKNQTVALVGSSGCGKSTVLQLIQRMYDPDTGTVLASRNDLRALNVKYYREHIAVVGQEPVLFAGSIKENIRLSNPSCTDEEIYAAAKQAYCHSFIKKLPDGYDTQLGERGAQLSGGQKQRIAIARALVRKPKILLLDEATSALDSHSEAKVQRALDAASFGRTTVMVSHRLATVVNADVIYFIDKGEVIEQGTHSELLAQKGRYYQLVLENEPSLSPTVGGPDVKPAEGKKVKKTRIKKQESEESVSSCESIAASEDSASESDQGIKSDDDIEVPSTWRILKLCAPEKWLMVLGTVAATVVGSSFPFFAMLFGETYGLLESRDENWVRQESNKISIMFLIVGVITGVATFIQIHVFNLTGVRLTARLRVDTFRAMLKQEIGWFDNALNGVGALCGRLAADASSVQGATGMRIGSFMQAAATIGIGILLSVYFTWKLTLVSLINVPLVIGAVVLEGRILSAGMDTMRLANEKATTIATEAITNIRTVSAFCGEEGVVERYKAASVTANTNARKSIRFRGAVFAFGQTAPVAGYAISLWYGGLLVADKQVPYKDVIKVSEALIFGAWMLGQALAFAPNFGAALRAAGRVFDLLERSPLVGETHSPCVRKKYTAQGKIQYKNIHFRYPTRREAQILKGLSLEIPAGLRVALVGPSGCGKSTLIQLLQRLYDPDEGRVYLDEYCIVNDMRLPTLRANLGIVSQEPVLFDRTIAENIAYGDNTRDVPIEDIVSAAKQANIHNFIAALPEGYSTRLGARASHLSGGQKQRLAIARALVRDPRVLLLDEATSALDTHSEKIVQEALDRASADRTCLIIAHRLATIQNADLICVIDQGVVAERGTHAELIAKRGIYARLYELQCGIMEEAEEVNPNAE